MHLGRATTQTSWCALSVDIPNTGTSIYRHSRLIDSVCNVLRTSHQKSTRLTHVMFASMNAYAVMLRLRPLTSLSAKLLKRLQPSMLQPQKRRLTAQRLAAGMWQSVQRNRNGPQRECTRGHAMPSRDDGSIRCATAWHL